MRRFMKNHGKRANAVKDPADTMCLRTRFWRIASVLTCSVLVCALAVAWVSSALVARSNAYASLSSTRLLPAATGTLVHAREIADVDVERAWKKARMDQGATSTGVAPAYDLGGVAPDSSFTWGAAQEPALRVLLFEDGSKSFADIPTSFMVTDDTEQGAWDVHALDELVEGAIDKREQSNAHLRPQLAEAGGKTWLWTTRVVVVNPAYDSSKPDENNGISFYASGDLADYAGSSYLAARMFSFVDVTPSVLQLKTLAITLGVAGVVGCAALVFVCHKVIDRALAPVGEAQARQRTFLIKASHELKTPMASLSSNLDALTANGDATVESQHRWTDNMRADIDDLAARTYALLDAVVSSDDLSEADEADGAES